MPDRPRLVLDTAIVVGCLVPELAPPPARRYWPVVSAAAYRRAVFLAPEATLHELLRVLRREVGVRGVAGRPEPQAADEALVRFMGHWPITYYPSAPFLRLAWGLVRRHGVEVGDALHLACAMHHDADLWVSHRYADGFTEAAERSHAGRVYVLAEQPFAA